MNEEIKSLEKIIEASEKMFEEVGETYSLTPDVIDTIKNLISKHKELEQMVKLMAKDIAENKLDEDICRKVKGPKKEDCYGDMYEACYGCVIEHYKKKAQIEIKIIQGLEEYVDADTGEEVIE